MYTNRIAAAVAVLTLTLAAGAARAADQTLPNPEFASWSKFKPGTSVTLKSVNEFDKTKLESVMTMTLVEVGADKLVIETTNVARINGMEIKSPPEKRDVAKTFTIPKVEVKDDPKAEKPKTEEGTETLKAAGVEVKAKWYKFTQEADGTKTESQTWMSDEIPGGLVKTVTKVTGAATATYTTEVVEFKKP
jgi:hypothetical protein